MNLVRTPALDNVIDCTASGEAGEVQALEFPVLVPIDLTDSHGIEITAERLAEMAAAYDPAIEQASLNLDHNWGGPSLGWCQRLWLQDGALWVRYTDLDPATIELIRTKRYTRRSAEIALNHPSTGGWYFTGCALLGNARPAVAGLPPVTLTAKEPPVPDPDPSTTATETALVITLRNQAAEATQLYNGMLRDNAELAVERRITDLGARLTPAMAKLARPLLVELLATRTPATVKLQGEDISIAERILQILAEVPTLEALTTGRMADDTPAPRLATDLPPERQAELEQKYHFTTSWGFHA